VIRFLPYGIELFLLVFCLIDCIQTPEDDVRNLGKVWWVLLILLFPIVGAVAWLVAGRPTAARRGRSVPWPSTRTAGFPEYERPGRRSLAPDDDPEFLDQMRQHNSEHEQLLRSWEEDLRRRERELGKEPPTGPATSDAE